ncbi:hypothetical protein Tco_0530532 [Tanacetum coccineum]
MTTMAENVLAVGVENRPPMLEKGHYDTWQSRILLYIEDKENGEILGMIFITHQDDSIREILQAQDELMEAIQAFLKEYDHIPPNEKCMALLLAEERLLKIKQAMEEEQNQPEVLQELLLKLINDLQILKGIQQEKKKLTAQSSIPYWNCYRWEEPI